MNKKAISLLSAVCLIVASFSFFSLANITTAAGYYTVEQRVTTSPSINYTISFFGTPQFPSIDGDRVVWKDDRNGNADIYMYDFNTSTETRITTDSNDQTWPVISGNTIVWQDNRNGNWDIYMYDLGTSTESQVTTDSNDQEQPCVSGDRIVWHDDRNYLASDVDIYMYTISTTTEAPLVTALGPQYSPYIDGNITVWEDGRSAYDIYYYDFTSPVVDGSVVSSSGHTQYWPTIDGNHISWTENRGVGSSYDIYMYDLGSSIEYNVTSGSSDVEAFGHMDGNIIVWTQQSGSTWNVYGYDFSRPSVGIFPITNLSSAQGMARIEGNRVVWGDARNDGGSVGIADIYSGEIYYDETPPTFNNLPNTNLQINITESQEISTDPFLIQVLPTDNGSGMYFVEFFANGDLICTDYTPDGNGIYDCLWDVTSSCDVNQISVTARDYTTNYAYLTRNFTISSSVCPNISACTF